MANLFDTLNYPEIEPAEIIAGDRASWKRTDLGTDYPPASYSFKYAARLENSGATEIEITASESGDEYIVEVGQAVTANYKAGTYHWQAYITRTSDSERITVDSGTWQILANRDATNSDPRNHVKKVLDAIESVIEGRASKDQENYSIQGRSLSRTPIADLIMLRSKYRAELVQEQRAERIKNNLGHSGVIKVRG
tara:strand:+ start:3997 stop:4581 length:585 start_codon:yes stop_codon:yes gene_type:complete